MVDFWLEPMLPLEGVLGLVQDLLNLTCHWRLTLSHRLLDVMRDGRAVQFCLYIIVLRILLWVDVLLGP